MSNVRWLHLSDLHVGLKEQGWLWPRYGNRLIADLKKIFEKSGPWDAVLFSGDMVNKGTPQEYEQLDGVLDTIWAALGELGCNPVLVSIPGNHDLSRSDSLAPEMIAFEQYWNKPAIRDEVWKKESQYRRFIEDRFENYTKWRDNSISAGRHLKPDNIGLLPGDASYSFPVRDFRVGVIALNSTWLQLGAGDYLGSLDVNPRQMMAVTQSNPDQWCQTNAFNFLMTHQPQDWLHPDSLEPWMSEINPSGRFDLHLFGHMHKPLMSRVARGGSAGRRLSQAASLFGLEKLADGTTERIQGYAAFSLAVSEGEATLRCWPRTVVKTDDGDRKLVPDVSQDLDEDNSFSFKYESTDNANTSLKKSELTVPERSDKTVKLLEAKTFDLDSIRLSTSNIDAHRHVREVERREFVQYLNEAGALWLVADWGMAAKEFVLSALKEISVKEDDVLKLDCSEYVDRDSFLAKLGASLGSSFENVFTAIKNNGSTVVILDEIPLSNKAESNDVISRDIEGVIKIIQDYAPETKIVLRSRVIPSLASFPTLALTAFDEPDLAIYVRESPIGDQRYAKPEAVGIIFRRTDGVPARVDDALRDLQVTSLADLAATNPDFAENAMISVTAPTSLVMAIENIRSSRDPDAPRAFDLLRALAALPYGEQLSRIRRFLGVHPFTTNHARYLLDRGLLSSITLSGMGENDSAEQVRALIVPRIVREYVISLMSEEQIKDTDTALANLYLGRRWKEGDIENSSAGKSARNALSESYEINNAITLILRMIVRAESSCDALIMDSLLRVAGALLSSLLTGNHYRNVASFTNDLIPILENGNYHKTLAIYRMQRARALRMLGDNEQSISCSLDIDLSQLSKSQKQDVYLSRGLAYERQGNVKLAVESANASLKIAPKSSIALHAQQIIAEQIEDQHSRIQALSSLLQQARKKDAKIAVNNILLSLASEPGTKLKREQLAEVVETARVTKDFWNVARATITLSELSPSGSEINSDLRKKLVDAYHFLHAERLTSLFDRCHECLWRVFEDTGDMENLLNLFRHSSFIWRLSGREVTERKYLKKLAGKMTQLVMSNIDEIEKDRSYFIVRVAVVIGNETVQ